MPRCSQSVGKCCPLLCEARECSFDVLEGDKDSLIVFRSRRIAGELCLLDASLRAAKIEK